MDQQDENEEEEYWLLLTKAKETLLMGHKLQIDFGEREGFYRVRDEQQNQNQQEN